MSGMHLEAGGTAGLEDAIAAVVREAALVGATVTITVNPVLPIPPTWSARRDQAAAVDDPPAEDLDPPDVERDLIMHLRDAPGEQLTLPEFVALVGGTIEDNRGFLRRAGRNPDSVKDWLYTRFYTKTADGCRVRTYRLTDAGRKVAFSEHWMSRGVWVGAAIDGG